MTATRTDFEQRCLEVQAYLDLLSTLEQSTKPGTSNETAIKAMKAGSFLLIYNLVEATMRGVYVEMFDALKAETVEFDDLTEDFRKVVWRNARRPSVENIIPKLRKIATDVVFETFDKEDLFSGNIDARKIRDSLKEIGLGAIKLPHDKNESLLKVKTARNDLAHGYKTFGEVGRATTAEELGIFFIAVKRQLEHVLTVMDSYVTNKGYALR